MDNANRFLPNFYRRTPYASTRDSHAQYSPQFSQPNFRTTSTSRFAQQQPIHLTRSEPVQSPFFSQQPVTNEEPLDDFDRDLLRESQASYQEVRRPVLARTALLPKPLSLSTYGGMSRQSHEDPYEHSALTNSSSSPAAPATSPTVSALQNRQRHKPAFPRSGMTSQPMPDDDDCGESETTMNMLPIHPRGQGRLSSQAQYSSKPTPVVQGIQLVMATELSDQLRSIFRFEIFNAVQSKCFPVAFQSDDNIIVSAPTGSGKTVIMELAICKLVSQSKGQDFKVIYQAPTKSLCAERYNDWQKKFAVLNLDCAELTGDTDNDHLQNVQKASIIITTPEKWDSVTRKWKDHAKLMQLVRLFLVDEVHILKDERGATLEAVVSRMKSVVANIRFVALSATVPNSEDIAVWLGLNSAKQHLPARREVFGESFRPVQLNKHVYGFEGRTNDFAFESMLTQQIPDIIAKHGSGKPVMVFCSTRRASVTTAKVLAKLWSESSPPQRLWRGPSRPLALTSPELSETALAGVAFHHGGLAVQDRRAIEQAFLNGQIKIICSTSTLAVGVNLPCYLVILKGTCAWTDNGFKEYADLEVMQMLGRAGRPQFESSACAVILTRKDKVARYEKMVSGDELLESCLHQNLIEHLNAEIVLGTVHDLATAKQWLASTFLHVRLQKNPSHYQFREGVEYTTDDEMLEQLCTKDIDLLLEAGIVGQQTRLTSTMFGEAMARYYVTFDTMKSFIGLSPGAKMSEILSLLAQAREFREVRMLAGEKSFYKAINKAPEIKFPIKVDIALPAHKISLLVQAELGNVALPDGETHKKHHQQYRIDKSSVFTHANRLIRCLIDCQVQLGDAISARHALELGRSLAAHVWDNTASQLRQVEGLGEVAVRKLAAASINSIETLLNTEPSRIELVLAKNPPFGHQLLKKLGSFPNLRVSVRDRGRELHTGMGATIKLNAEIGFLNDVPPEKFNRRTFSVCFLVEDSKGTLLEFRRFSARKLKSVEQVFLTLKLTRATSHLNCHVMCDTIAGTGKYAELDLSDIPASIFPTHPAKRVDVDLKRVGHGPKPVQVENAFDTEDIDDEDLLALDVVGGCEDYATLSPTVGMHHDVEVVEDIDVILETEAEKSKSSKLEHKDSTTLPAWREPKQLANGRWTCQHDCKEQGKICKHACCKDGVAKPSRRPKGEAEKKDGDTSQKKLTSMASLKPKDGHLTEHKIKAPSTTQKKLSDIEKVDSQERPGAKRKRPSPDTEEGISRRHRTERVEHRQERAHRTAKSSKASRSDFWGEEPDIGFESDDSSLEIACKMPKKETEVSEEDLFADLDDDAFLYDFSFVETCRSEDPLPVNEKPSPTLGHASNNKTSVATDDKPNSLHESDSYCFDTQMDLSEFDPPVEHVSMSDILKKDQSRVYGFIGKNNPEVQHFQDVQAVSDHDHSLLTLSDPLTQVDHHMGPLNNNEEHADADSPLDTLATTPWSMPVGAVEDCDWLVGEPAITKESDDDLLKRLHEEEQKRKWEGIDPWLYEEFHNYVDII